MTNVGFVFPGQGSQFKGMLADLAARYTLITDHFKLVSDKLGYDLWTLVQDDPDEKLNQTEYTQVAMLTADVAIYNLVQSLSTRQAQVMAGHSLGEYAALVCASAITLEDAAHLVAMRGKLMQETVPAGQGAMAAIVGLSDDEVNLICQEASDAKYRVSAANYNAIGQVVIAGHTSAVEAAITLAEAKGARMAKIIPVSVPCHCDLLEEAASAFEPWLAKAPFKTPAVKVISNVDLSIYQSADQIRKLLKEQLYRPVRWVETIQHMKSMGIDLVVECGPGKVLSGLVKRIDRALPAQSMNDLASFEQNIESL